MKRTPFTVSLILASSLGFHARAVDFAKDIQPVLETRCLECHNPNKVKGKLLMDTIANLIKGGEDGASIVPGDATKGTLLERVTLAKGHDDIMPPKGDPLSAQEIANLKQWITEGAKVPEGLVMAAKSAEELKAIASLQAKLPTLKTVEILPKDFNLESSRDFHKVIVMARFSDDTTKDVTKFANLQVANPKLAKLDGDILRPLEDGTTEVTASIGGQAVKAALVVKDAKKDRSVSFNLDVMPIWMRTGCNQGGCHGAARGKDGFRLSLFGFDPDGDYTRLTREMVGRRINLAIPEESTLIEKAVGAVPHSGNQCFDEKSEYYKTVIEWINNGTPKDPATIAKVTGVEIYPLQAVLEGAAATQQITVRAKYSDGTDRDVTSLALFSSNNDGTASISKQGLVTSGDRGEAFVLARFDVFSITSQILVIPDKLKYERPKLAETNYIDQLANEKLHKLRIIPSGLAPDDEFVRRVFIDVTGVMPKPAEVKAFMADTSPNKREALIDSLLQRKEFTELWVMKWSELLQVRSGVNNNTAPFYKNALLYYNWLQEKIAKNQPINEIVVDLLSASGGTVSNPPVNYYQTEIDPIKTTENVAQVFMGMRIQCAQCHNHPFDRWTLNDYYGFKSFFMQIGRKQTDDPQEVIIYNSKGGDATHPVTGAKVTPKFLGGSVPEVKPGDDRRKLMAKWIASPENPYFSRNIANIVWTHFFGVGIVDPVDDVRISNPPSNPELLDALAKKLTEYNYDIRKFVKDLAMSQTYQRTSITNDSNEKDKRNFAHAMVRRVRAEVLLDAISTVTNTPNKFQGLPLGARAVQIADGAVSNYFLTTFGRASRTTVCSCEVKMEPSLSQALHLMNGDAVHENIRKGKVVAEMVKEGKKDKEVVEELYLRCFGRVPNDTEWKAVNQALTESADNRQAVLEDLFWALLNSKEFYFTH
jgi:mono/diheme cytochrome c family protein